MTYSKTEHFPHSTAVTTLPNDTITYVPYDPQPLLYFRPETGEFILVPAEDMSELQSECNLLRKVIEGFHQANKKIDEYLSLLLTAMQHPNGLADSSQVDIYQREVNRAMEERDGAHKALIKELKPLSNLQSKTLTMVELIPIALDKHGNRRSLFGKYKLHYVRSNKIKSSWHKFGPVAFEDMKGRHSEKKTGSNSFIKQTASGHYKIDMEKLKDGILLDREKSIRSQLHEKINISSEIVEKSINGTLFEWAEAWNQNLQYHAGAKDPYGVEPNTENTQESQTLFNNNVSLDAEAQLMRYLAGVGLDAEWSPAKGRVAFKASTQAKLAVAEGKASGGIFFLTLRGGFGSSTAMMASPIR